jgi:hypothetical protein
MIKELAVELIGMFIGETGLTIGILGVVAAAAAALDLLGLDPLVAGAVLICGCLGMLIESVARGAKAGAP